MEAKWYDVYKIIANELYNFYLVNEKAGERLFEKLISNKEFIKYNNWIVKYSSSEFTKSVDPIHIFSSFNANKQKNENKVKRINTLLKIFSKEKFIEFSSIDFYGCPAPFNIKMMSMRDTIYQDEIWECFINILSKNQKGLLSKHFTQYKKWYGIDLMSFTQFLFWVNSDNFLPLDKNTTGLLLALKKIDRRPNNIKEYKFLLSSESTSIYREFTAIAYDIMTKGIQDVSYSKELSLYLGNEKVKPFRQSHFKIIAIKPLDKINSDYLKILEVNKIYKFYSSFDFENGNDQEIKINRYLIDLYKIENFPNLSISAIVGKNGKGKSTITELIYMGIYNLSINKGLLGKRLQPLVDLNFEMFYTSDSMYKIRFENEIIKIYKYESFEDSFINPTEIKFDDFHLDSFFYTIAINYSHYGFNSKKLKFDWITPLSHKNDGYQTPIVINPMRTEGNFNINREDDLLKSRLLSNILEPVGEDKDYSLRKISDIKLAKTINLKLQKDKIEFLIDNIKLSVIKPTRQKFILNEVYKHFYISETEIPFKDILDSYIVKKLAVICLRYKSYKSFFDSSNYSFRKDKVEEFMKTLSLDQSHVTFKLLQAINYLKYNHYADFITGLEEEINIDIEDLSNKIELVKSLDNEFILRTIYLIPPSIFTSQIILNDGTNLDNISSGENQLINIVSSIVYHLNNLDSVVINKSLYNYGYVNIMLDEVELYFHPDFQRKFIDYLLNYISKVNLDKIEGINLCLITHSPFILSDIIDENILFLGENSDVLRKTFGANIFDLLSDSFFLSDGIIGEFAEKRIQEVINYLNNFKNEKEVWFKNKTEVKLLIDKIGEPYLNEKLNDMFLEAFPDSKNDEIKRLEEKLERLKNGTNPNKQ